MATLDEWTAQVCQALGLDPGTAEGSPVLEIAREVAHGVARPAAPLTAYLIGVAVGRGTPAHEVSATVRDLLRQRPPAAPPDEG